MMKAILMKAVLQLQALDLRYIFQATMQEVQVMIYDSGKPLSIRK